MASGKKKRKMQGKAHERPTKGAVPGERAGDDQSRRSSLSIGFTSAIWSNRSTPQRIMVVVVVLCVACLIAVTLSWSTDRRSPDEVEATEARSKVDPLNDISRRPLAEMERLLAGADPSTKAEADEAARQADRWGYEFSIAKQSYVIATMPIESLPERSRYQMANGVISTALWSEAAENIYLLPYMDPQVWPAMMNQARRLTALGKASLAAQYLTLAEEFGVEPTGYMESFDYPLIPDRALIDAPFLPPLNVPGAEISPARYGGVPASLIMSEPDTVPFGDWANELGQVAENSQLSALNTALCERGEALAYQREAVPPTEFTERIARFTQIGNALGNLPLPDTLRGIYGGVYHSTRSLAESALVYALLGGGHTTNAEALYRLRVKGIRLTNLSGVQWQNSLELSRQLGRSFYPLPACYAELFAVYHTPWDARGELTRTLPA